MVSFFLKLISKYKGREDKLSVSNEAVLPCFGMVLFAGVPHPCNFWLRNTIHSACQHLFAAQWIQIGIGE